MKITAAKASQTYEKPERKFSGTKEKFDYKRFLTAGPFCDPATICACEGQCPRCQPIQAKLKVSAPNDPLEQEADRIAQQITNAPSLSPSPPISQPVAFLGIQRACPDGQCLLPDEKPEKEEVPMQFKALDNRIDLPSDAAKSSLHTGSGIPMPQTMRDFFEPRFGYDFSRVRLHTDAQSAQTADRMHAKAYTMGNHVVFGSDYYQPASPAGQELLAHELTHTIQQQGGEPGKIGDSQGLCVQRGTVNFDSMNPDLLYVPDMGPEMPSPQSLQQRTVERSYPSTDQPNLMDFLMDLILNEDEQQFVRDLIDSVDVPWSMVCEVMGTEVIDAIGENLAEFLSVTILLILAESLVAGLAGTPTGISQIAAIILQALIILILGYYVVVEVEGLAEEAEQWITLVQGAHGDQAVITEASIAFLRMIRHMIVTILLVAGIRVRVGGIRTSFGNMGRIRGTSTPQTLAPGEPLPENVVRFPGNQPVEAGTSPQTGAYSGPSMRATGTGDAAPLSRPEPVIEPMTEPVLEPLFTPTPITRIGPNMSSVPLTGADVAADVAAGISAATSEEEERRRRRRDCNPLPISWPEELPTPEDVNLVRVRSAERDWENLEPRGRNQRYLADQIRLAHVSDDPVERYDAEEYVVEHSCFDYDSYEHYDAHHIQPLYLGGQDLVRNLCALEHDRHVEGHPLLDDQEEWSDTYRQCGIASGYLHNHPDYTEYYIADTK